MNRFWARLRRLTGRRLVRAIKRSWLAQWLWSDRYLIIFRIDRAQSAAVPAPSATPVPVRINSLEDLGKYDETVGWVTRAAFLAEAQGRMADGEKAFTTADDGCLLEFGWLVPSQAEGYFPLVDQLYQYPPGSAVMYNGFCHPRARGRGLHQISLRSRILWAFSQPGTNYVYAAIEVDNTVSRHCSEKLGLRPQEVLFRRCRFGHVTKGRLPPSFVAEYDANR